MYVEGIRTYILDRITPFEGLFAIQDYLINEEILKEDFDFVVTGFLRRLDGLYDVDAELLEEEDQPLKAGLRFHFLHVVGQGVSDGTRAEFIHEVGNLIGPFAHDVGDRIVDGLFYARVIIKFKVIADVVDKRIPIE